ncbi:MAG: extracellular solute-binding protein [Endomicrobium sp.]|jgi:ABC-type glycerol-3-phosphate transport system substrate-binding protein|uniref:extracellular solute-binding protein n=1 Tax=Candidatus Endomicrobiellum cubanum TaxID=3242325 RepID=UPI002839FE58|nr:extracellular solute-binding protein [Endomicrobium sp.]MDR2395223.1 extracellular solute-binding protein [Endomicrobium sp.]
MNHFKLIVCLLLVFVFFGACRKNVISTKYDVVVWHWMPEKQKAFEVLAKKYLQETGIRVVFKNYYPKDVYRNKVSMAQAAKELPEIFSPLADKIEIASFIQEGFIANLSKDLNEESWKDVFFEEALVKDYYENGNEWNIDPGIYSIPLDMQSLIIFYNKDLFAKAGLDPNIPPSIWQEFIEIGKKLKQANIKPFVSGFAQGWFIGSFAKFYEMDILGQKGILETINGKLAYTDEKWVKIFNLFKDMQDNDFFAPSIMNMTNNEAEKEFASGKAAMIFGGSWALPMYADAKKKINLGIFLPPPVSKSSYVKSFTSGGTYFYVNQSSPNKQKAIDFLKWLTQISQQVLLSQETLSIPANKEIKEQLPKILNIFYDNAKNAYPPLPKQESWQVTNYFSTNLQAIIIGEKSPVEAAKYVQVEKQKQIKN